MSQSHSKRSDDENALKELTHRILHPGLDRGWTQATIRELNERKTKRERELHQHFLASIHASIFEVSVEFEQEYADNPDSVDARRFREEAVKRLGGEASVLHPAARKSMPASEWKHVVADACKTISDRERTRIANAVMKNLLDATPGEQGSKSAVERLNRMSQALRGKKPKKLKTQTNAEFEESFDQHLSPSAQDMLATVIGAVCPDFARSAVRDAALEALGRAQSQVLNPSASGPEKADGNS